MSVSKKQFKGLNTLRFMAALTVLVSHCQQNLLNYDIQWLTNVPFLYKGSIAVEFFFVLSGFLLTYLCYQEYDLWGRIDIKAFYMRRILRIFPLYYLAILLGYGLLGWVYPYFLGANYFQFELRKGILYHLCFLPNYMNSLHGNRIGALFSLWSIGVEEQFYLFFPFFIILVQKLKRPFLFVISLTVLYYCIYFLFLTHKIFLSKTINYCIGTLKFHFMFIGCATALLFYKYPSPISRLQAHPLFQWITAILFFALFFSNLFENSFIIEAIGFSSLILLAISDPPKNSLFDMKLCSYWGSISYGIYIYHPYVSYLIRFILEKNILFMLFIKKAPLCYYLAELVITLIIAHFSYNYFELYFIRQKAKYAPQ